MLRDCRALSLKVSVLPRLADVLGPAVEIDDVEGVTVLGVNPPWLPRSSRAVKRGMDLLIATAFLIVVAPVLRSSRSPSSSTRAARCSSARSAGRGGRDFRIVKFRTMVVDAEASASSRADASRAADAGCLKIDRRPADHARRARACAAGASTSCRSSGTCCAAR